MCFAHRLSTFARPNNDEQRDKAMGIFESIKNAIWGDEEETDAANKPADKPVIMASAAPGTPASTPPVSISAASPAAPTPATPPAAPASIPAATAQPVDVAAMLDAAQKRSGQDLDWRRSIVDLMKALNLDSSLANRKELAKELNYPGDPSDSATMNVWLRKALLKKLAENGGQVPADLID